MTGPGQPRGYRPQSSDTDAETERYLFDRLRSLPPWRKAEMLSAATRSAYGLAMTGLRQRYPSATETELVVRLPDPVIRFAVKKKKNTPVLIHKYRGDDAYPSAFQTEDGKINVEATLSDGGPAAGVPVYFRLVDPKDTAPYASTGAGDNKGGLGTIDCGSGSGTSCMAVSAYDCTRMAR